VFIKIYEAYENGWTYYEEKKQGRKTERNKENANDHRWLKLYKEPPMKTSNFFVKQ
jgi:hypothetical protein